MALIPSTSEASPLSQPAPLTPGVGDIPLESSKIPIDEVYTDLKAFGDAVNNHSHRQIKKVGWN